MANYAAVKLYRHRRKKRMVEYLGGKCSVTECQYSKCMRSLVFHHVAPSKKEFQLSNFINKRWDIVKKELDKCILLCANCHGEIHEKLGEKL